MNRSFRVLVFLFLAFSLGGCAASSKSAKKTLPPQTQAQPQSGFYHRVNRGETLWRIAKTYGIDLDELLSANNISDSRRIEVGQNVLIPKKTGSSAPVSYGDEDFIWPLKGRVISEFGSVSNNAVSKGINIEPLKSDSVLASRSGKVVFSHDDFLDFGKTVIIEHPDGFWTVYARNSEVFVKAGDTVTRASLIARVGSAGRDKTNYLHFQIRKGSLAKNPIYYLP